MLHHLYIVETGKTDATNANHTYPRTEKIMANFITKDRQKEKHIEQNKVMWAVPDKERGARQEGLYAVEKQ